MALSGVRSSWLICARKRDLARLAASAWRRASSDFALACSSSPISASFSARASSVASVVEIQPVRQHGEIALGGERHGRQDVAVHVAAQDEIQRHRGRHRHGCGDHRHRQARRQHARHGDDQQHDEQHEGGRALVAADQMHEVEHPGETEEQVEQHEAHAPGAQVEPARSLGQELAAHRHDDPVDHHHRGGPDARLDRAAPQAGQEADRGDEGEDGERCGLPVLREQAQQLVVEGRTGAGGRGQPIARLAHALCGEAPMCRARLAIGGGRSAFPTHCRTHAETRYTHQTYRDWPKNLKTSLKATLIIMVNDAFLQRTAATCATAWTVPLDRDRCRILVWRRTVSTAPSGPKFRAGFRENLS